MKKFKSSFNVYYEDTDAGGVVYYANYLKFIERARTDAIASVNFTNSNHLGSECSLAIAPASGLVNGCR